MDRFEDLMGITIETGDAYLDKKLNNHICYKGGGGASKTTSSIPEWMRPHVEGYLQKGVRAEAAGDLSKVAGFTRDQEKAMALGRSVADQQGQLGQAAVQQAQALAGRDATDISGIRDAFLQQARTGGDQAATQANLGAAARGTLGGARGRRAAEQGRAAAQEQAALGFAQAQQQADQQDFANKQGLLGQTAALQQGIGAGAQTLGKIGQQGQQQAQREADATWQGLQRLGQLFGTASSTATDSTAKQGGGK